MTPSGADDHSPVEDLERVGSTRPLDLPTKARPYNSQEHIDKTTALLAGALVGILALTVLFSLIVVTIWPDRTEGFLKLLGLVFSPLVALVASAVGYYFGGRNGVV